jgi:hypothetical protein
MEEPTQSESDRTADPPQGDSFQQQAFNQRLLLLRDDVIFWDKDKGTPTDLALVVLFPCVNAAYSGESDQ